MTTTYALTRQLLDSMLGEEEQLRLGCVMHPDAGVDAIYEDGRVSLSCRECESVCVAVQLASGSTLPVRELAMAGEGR